MHHIPLKATPTNHLDYRSDIPPTPAGLLFPRHFTCATCATTQALILGARDQSTALCSTCLRRFRQREKHVERTHSHLTSFPRLLSQESVQDEFERDLKAESDDEGVMLSTGRVVVGSLGRAFGVLRGRRRRRSEGGESRCSSGQSTRSPSP